MAVFAVFVTPFKCVGIISRCNLFSLQSIYTSSNTQCESCESVLYSTCSCRLAFSCLLLFFALFSRILLLRSSIIWSIKRFPTFGGRKTNLPFCQWGSWKLKRSMSALHLNKHTHALIFFVGFRSITLHCSFNLMFDLYCVPHLIISQTFIFVLSSWIDVHMPFSTVYDIRHTHSLCKTHSRTVRWSKHLFIIVSLKWHESQSSWDDRQSVYNPRQIDTRKVETHSRTTHIKTVDGNDIKMTINSKLLSSEIK